jgi:hypothetical protein
MPGKKPCPNPACGEVIHDWHTEWLTREHRGLVFNGQAGIDCPLCGSSVSIPSEEVIGLAPDTVPMFRRSREQANKWAFWSLGSPTIDAYLKTLEGSQYASYQFEV